MKIILFLDTETSGLPERNRLKHSSFYPPEMYEKYDNARMIEIACSLYELNEQTSEMFHIKSFSSLVVPNGFTIENDSIHGITTDKANTYGNALQNVLQIFHYEFLNHANEIIGHNIEYDINILLSESYRITHDIRNHAPYQGTRNNLRTSNMQYETLYEELKKIPTKCTMKIGQKVLKLQKYPKLIDLYSVFNPNGKHQNHRALEDVQWTSVCYAGLRKMINDNN